MPRVESQVAPWQTGDGRSFEVQYPAQQEWGVVGQFDDTSAYCRHADRNVFIFNSSGNGTITAAVRNNIPCYKMLNTDVVPNNSIFARQTADWLPVSTRLAPPALGGGAPPASQNFPFVQVYGNFAFDAPPPANADMGFAIVAPTAGFQSGDGHFVRPTTPILAEWTILADGRPALVGNNQGFTGEYILPYNLPIDITQFHTYEIRILQANLVSFGGIQAYLDGKLHVALSYGPGNILPAPASGFPNFTFSMLNTGGNTTAMYIQRMCWRMAPSAPNLA